MKWKGSLPTLSGSAALPTRVLIVDRHPPSDAGILRGLFESPSAWSFEWMAEGRLALDRLACDPAGVIVADMRLPDTDGVGLLQEVQRRHPEVARILIAGHTDWNLVLRSLGAAHRYLPRTGELGHLRDAVEGVESARQRLGDAVLCPDLWRVTALPSQVQSRDALLAELRRPEPSLTQAAALVEQDAGLTLQVLRACNAACFGTGRPIVSAATGVRLLGLPAVGLLATTCGHFDPDRPLAAVSADLHRHGLATARLARDIALAERWPTGAVDLAFTAGLLHDVGHAWIGADRPIPSRRVLSMRLPGTSPIDRQPSLFGACHAGIAASLFALWGLPQALADVVGYHHRPSFAPRPSKDGALPAVHIADALLHSLDAQDGGSLDQECLRALGLQACAERWEHALRAWPPLRTA